MSKNKADKDIVVRMSVSNNKRIKELIPKGTLNERLSQILDTLDAIQNGDTVFIVNGKVYVDIADARGEAILSSVRRQEVPRLPQIAIIVGDDPGPN